MNPATLKKPSAVVPIAISLLALGIVIAHIAVSGTARQADEGPAAHLWQILMAGQLPVIAWFAIKWLPQAPKQAFMVLGMQFIAGLAACAPVYLLHW